MFRQLVIDWFAITTLNTAAVQQAELPDIRGLTFTSPYRADLVVGGVANGIAFETPRAVGTYDRAPHTFDVVADAAFPDDATRIQINTRLTYPDVGPVPNCPTVNFELRGSYNRVNGDISVTGSLPGTSVWDAGRGVDPFGALSEPTEQLVLLQNASLTLNGKLTQGAYGSLTLRTTDGATPVGGPGNFTVAAATAVLKPELSCDTANPLATVVIASPYGGVDDWSATHSTCGVGLCGAGVLPMLPLMLGSLLGLKRGRRRRSVRGR